MRRRFKQESDENSREKILDVDASMQGTMCFRDPVNLRINGSFDGKLDTKGTLMIGEQAEVTAEITGEQITIAGKVKGNIKASREVKLVSPACVIGNIETPVLSVAEGAVMDGNIKMGAQGSFSGPQKGTLTIEEVARYLEVEDRLVMEWANNGKLPGVRDGSVWRFDRNVVDSWVANEKIN
ncbi:MAG: polymer-forming cytoskeletal protein [Candidatus Omnitrophota bacterium]